MSGGAKGGRLVYSLSREREQNVTFNGAELKDSDWADRGWRWNNILK